VLAFALGGCYTRFTHPRAALFQEETYSVETRYSPVVLDWYYANYGAACAYYTPWWLHADRGDHGGLGHSDGGPVDPLRPAPGGAFGRGGRGEPQEVPVSPPPAIAPAKPEGGPREEPDSAAGKPGNEQPQNERPKPDPSGIGGRGGRR